MHVSRVTRHKKRGKGAEKKLHAEAISRHTAFLHTYTRSRKYTQTHSPPAQPLGCSLFSAKHSELGTRAHVSLRVYVSVHY